MTDESLPTQDDFDPWHGNPDAGWAHNVFGGLTISEAMQKYHERPDMHPEAFMCMGGKAFAYYFPVLEQFVYSLPNLTNDHEDWENPHGWILAKSIEAQFDARDIHHVRSLATRVLAMAEFVQQNLGRFEGDVYGTDEESVSDAWYALAQTVIRVSDSSESTTRG